METQRIEVAAGLVFHKGRLLITQRPEGGHLARLWEFPGGKREPGESYEECVRRELREELAIEVEAGDTLCVIDHDYPATRVRLKFIRCRWVAGEPRAIGCLALAWVTPVQLGDFEFPPADRRILQELTDRKEWWDQEAGGSPESAGGF